jgi:phage major head subunit gpT-like protein
MILDGNWQDALEPIAKKNFNVGLKEIPAEKSMLFDVVKSDKLTETYLEIGDVGSMEEFNGSVPYDDISQGYKMTMTAKGNGERDQDSTSVRANGPT